MQATFVRFQAASGKVPPRTGKTATSYARFIVTVKAKTHNEEARLSLPCKLLPAVLSPHGTALSCGRADPNRIRPRPRARVGLRPPPSPHSALSPTASLQPCIRLPLPDQSLRSVSRSHPPFRALPFSLLQLSNCTSSCLSPTEICASKAGGSRSFSPMPFQVAFVFELKWT